MKQPSSPELREATQAGATSVGPVVARTAEITPAAGRLLGGASLLAGGSVASYALSFARTLILARVLAKTDFGVAVLLSNALALIETATRMSFGQQVVQSELGDSREFRDSAHAFQLVLGMLGAAVMCAVALATSRLTTWSHLAWPIAALSVVPLAKGFENLDVFRHQRRFNHTPAVLYDLIPQLVVTVLTWPLAVLLKDYRAVLVVLLCKPLLGLIATHVWAIEPYRFSWGRQHLATMLKFGVPLMLNGVLMFASQYADQFVVAGMLSASGLASYALAFSLASIPWALVVQPATSFMLPMMSRLQNDGMLFRRHYRLSAQLSAVAGLLLTLPLVVSGERMVTLVFGAKYEGTGPVLAVLAATAVLRFLRFPAALASMARGDTRNQLYSNLLRAVSLPVALLMVGSGGTVLDVAFAALVSEVAAATFALVHLSRRHAVPVRESQTTIAFLVVALASAFVVTLTGSQRWGVGPTALLLLLSLSVTSSAAWLLFPDAVRPIVRTTAQWLRPAQSA